MIYINIVSLKIATGKLKGSTLLSTDQARELRPTQAKVREALVNIIRSVFMDDDFSEMRALDLYAGIGSLGFEFLSNDFQEVVFCDYDNLCISLIKKNSQKLKLADKSKAVKMKLPQGLKDLKRLCKVDDFTFDLVLLDPPYKLSEKDFMSTIRVVLDEKLLKKDGILVIETDQKNLLNTLLDCFSEDLALLKDKRYGDTLVFIFKNSH